MPYGNSLPLLRRLALKLNGDETYSRNLLPLRMGFFISLYLFVWCVIIIWWHTFLHSVDNQIISRNIVFNLTTKLTYKRFPDNFIQLSCGIVIKQENTFPNHPSINVYLIKQFWFRCLHSTNFYSLSDDIYNSLQLTHIKRHAQKTRHLDATDAESRSDIYFALLFVIVISYMFLSGEFNYHSCFALFSEFYISHPLSTSSLLHVLVL